MTTNKSKLKAESVKRKGKSLTAQPTSRQLKVTDWLTPKRTEMKSGEGSRDGNDLCKQNDPDRSLETGLSHLAGKRKDENLEQDIRDLKEEKV